MRIVKLSDTETGFKTLDRVRSFFRDEIKHCTPPGKFAVTAGRIAEERLSAGEALVFTYQARVVFTARAATGLTANDDKDHREYPSYFLVDISTLREADEDLHDVEREYNDATGADKNLVHSQGWVILPDSAYTDGMWARLRTPAHFTLPEEVADLPQLVEGAVCSVTINAYERNSKARQRCIEHYGTICSICGFSFAARYGTVADGIIHVHHLRSLSEIGREYVIDPVKDLRPVCPNCHAVLHCRGPASPAYSIEEVRAFLR